MYNVQREGEKLPFPLWREVWTGIQLQIQQLVEWTGMETKVIKIHTSYSGGWPQKRYRMVLISFDLFNSLPNLPKLWLDSTLEIYQEVRAYVKIELIESQYIQSARALLIHYAITP